MDTKNLLRKTTLEVKNNKENINLDNIDDKQIEDFELPELSKEEINFLSTEDVERYIIGRRLSLDTENKLDVIKIIPMKYMKSDALCILKKDKSKGLEIAKEFAISDAYGIYIKLSQHDFNADIKKSNYNKSERIELINKYFKAFDGSFLISYDETTNELIDTSIDILDPSIRDIDIVRKNKQNWLTALKFSSYIPMHEYIEPIDISNKRSKQNFTKEVHELVKWIDSNTSTSVTRKSLNKLLKNSDTYINALLAIAPLDENNKSKTFKSSKSLVHSIYVEYTNDNTKLDAIIIYDIFMNLYLIYNSRDDLNSYLGKRYIFNQLISFLEN